MMKKIKTNIGIILILFSALSSCLGQLMWKFASNENNFFLYMIGFVIYGIGALLMIISFKFGDLSILHPMLSAGYIISIFIGHFVLNETITLNKLAGLIMIIIGIIVLEIFSNKAK